MSKDCIKIIRSDSRSVWEVIRDHDDYILGARSQPMPPSLSKGGNIWKETKFQLLRQSNKRIVVCLDYSTSMGLGNRFERVMQAAVQYLSLVWFIVCIMNNSYRLNLSDMTQA